MDGILWATDSSETKLFGYNPVNGINVLNITLPFPGWGITTDGTYLYVSVGSGSPNGTIAKVMTDGTISSYIHITLPSGIFSGLAWDGSYLWAHQTFPNSLLKIHPTTGAVVQNFSIPENLYGLTFASNLLWGVDWALNRIRGYDPASGELIESFYSQCSDDAALGTNGTHFFESDYDNGWIHISDLPTEAGELFHRISVPSNPTDVTWNGSHYLYGDSFSIWIEGVYGGYYSLFAFNNSFVPYGITTVAGSLYASQQGPPYNIYKITSAGSIGIILNNFTGVGVAIESLAYDGVNLWAQGTDNKTYKLNPADCSKLAEYSLGDLAGITYDWINEVLWAIDPVADKLKQIDLATMTFNGVEIDTSINTYGERGLTFDGKHLIIASATTGYLYKIIIAFNPPGGPGGIPGFADIYLYLTLLLIVGVFLLHKHQKAIF